MLAVCSARTEHMLQWAQHSMDHDLRKIYVNISEGYLYLRASVVKDAVISEHLSFRHFLYNSAKSLISCDFISVAVFSPTCHAHCFFSSCSQNHGYAQIYQWPWLLVFYVSFYKSHRQQHLFQTSLMHVFWLWWKSTSSQIFFRVKH